MRLVAAVLAVLVAGCDCNGTVGDLDAGSGGGSASGGGGGSSAGGGGAGGGSATGGGSTGGGAVDGGDTDAGEPDAGSMEDAGTPDAGPNCADIEDAGGSPWTPANLCGLAFWVTSDTGLTLDGQGHVTGWADRSGQGNDLTGSCNRVISASGAVQCSGADLLTTASSPSLGVGDDFVVAFVGNGCCSTVDATWFSVGDASLGTDHVNISSLVGTVGTDVLRTQFDPQFSLFERMRLHAGRLELCNYTSCPAALDPTTATAGTGPQVLQVGIRVPGGTPAGNLNVREIVVAKNVSDASMALLLTYLQSH